MTLGNYVFLSSAFFHLYKMKWVFRYFSCTDSNLTCVIVNTRVRLGCVRVKCVSIWLRRWCFEDLTPDTKVFPVSEGARSNVRTSAEWPWKLCSSCPLSTSHNAHVPSPLDVRIWNTHIKFPKGGFCCNTINEPVPQIK